MVAEAVTQAAADWRWVVVYCSQSSRKPTAPLLLAGVLLAAACNQ